MRNSRSFWWMLAPLIVAGFLPGMCLGQQVASTLAGSVQVNGNADGPAKRALFHDPTGLAMDAAGNLFIADNQNHTIRKLATNGVVSTFAGRAETSGSSNGKGTNAYFNSPSGIAVAANGTLYVTDTGNDTIRAITTNGTVTTLAGKAGQSGATNGSATLTRFNAPLGIAIDHRGNLIVADSGNYTIRKVTTAGVTSTLAGTPEVWGSEDGPGSSALFNCPLGVAVDAAGNIFVSDVNNFTIRKITAAGAVSTWAGQAGEEGNADGTGSDARFGKPAELKFNADGNLYVVDAFNCVIRKITTNAVVTTMAGLPAVGGAADGLGDEARFFNPYGLAVDHNANLRVSDTYNETIRLVYNPITLSLERNATSGGVLLNWQGNVGSNYQVQYRDGVRGTNWQNLGVVFTATNILCERKDGMATGVGGRFYRVVLAP